MQNQVKRHWKLIAVVASGLAIWGLSKLGLDTGAIGITGDVRELVELAIMAAAVYKFPKNS